MAFSKDYDSSPGRASGISRLCQAPDDRLALCLAGDVSIEDVPVGTGVWLGEE